MIRYFQRWWRKIGRWEGRLLRRGEGRPDEGQRSGVTEPGVRVLSDRQYESLFRSLLNNLDSLDQVQTQRVDWRNDRDFVSWLRRFGQTLLTNAAANGALAERMIRLSEVDAGALSVCSGEIGRQLLSRAAEPQTATPAKQVRNTDSEQVDEEKTDQYKQAEFYFQQGNEAYSRGEFKAAINAYDAALNIEPDFHRALSNKGLSLDHLGQHEDAITAYNAALKIKPDFHQALYNKGNSLYRLGQYENAIAVYDAATHIKPDFHQAFSNKGLSLAHLGQYEAVIAACDAALSIKPDDHQALYSKGNSLLNLGQYEDAISVYDAAIHIKPDFPQALSNKGNSLAHLGQYEDAISVYDAAIHIKPDLYEALYSKGNSLHDLGQYEDAIKAYDAALNIKPDLHQALSSKGHSLHNLGQYEAAIAAYDAALNIKPDDHQAWLGRGRSASQSFQCTMPVALSLLISLQHSSLDQRGYEGQLACYTIGLTHVQQSQNPEGWGQLHHATGHAHYFYGRFLPQADIYLSQAIASYQTALTTLTAFPKNHLNVLQDAIRAYLGLGNSAKVKECREQGLEVFRQLLNNAATPAQKQQLEQQFSGFSQLQVDTLIRETNPTTALEVAERYKNRTLGWLLDQWQEPISPSWPEMQSLLTPHTAALYWHLSPDSLSTFLLTADTTEPQVISVTPIEALKTWMKEWQQRYQTYRKKSKATDSESVESDRPNHPWRLNLEPDLQKLQEILGISKLEQSLSSYTHLLLVPHRELHQLPIHALFTTPFITTYLPSLQTGLTLKAKPPAPTQQPALLPALLLETPENDELEPLVLAEVETALVAHLCRQHAQPSTLFESHKAHTQPVTDILSQPHRLFHFTGHAAHNYGHPKNSAIALTGTDTLTANAITKLPLDTYDLVTLAACETAVAGQTDLHTDYVGLASAFLTAGARQVISTLWTVDSESNAWLMVKFYQQYLTGAAAPLALHNAQQWIKTVTYARLADWLESLNATGFKQSCQNSEDETLTDTIGKHRLSSQNPDIIQTPYANPYYWAAFTLTGYCHEGQ